MSDARKHDETKCRCDDDFSAASYWLEGEPIESKITCPCQCGRCMENRQKIHGILRVAVLQNRLEKANIDIDDLAYLVWIRIEPAIQNEIGKMAREELQRSMKGLKIYSKVTGSDSW